jgi:hypothetical protein
VNDFEAERLCSESEFASNIARRMASLLVSAATICWEFSATCSTTSGP